MSSYQQDHIHITNPDPQKTVKFYTEIMGAKITKRNTSGLIKSTDLDLGGIPLRVSADTGADNILKELICGVHHIGLTVPNLDKATEELKSAGVEFIVEPFSPRPGLKTAYIRTPDGILFELVEYQDN